MQDLERDLARYGTFLRDHAPVVDLDEVETRVGRRPSSHGPVRAAVAGALVALASIGLLFFGVLLVDVFGPPSPTHRPSVTPTGGPAPGPAVLTIVVGSGAVAVLMGAVAVGLRRRHQNQKPERIAKSRERRKQKMRTMEKPIAPVERLERSNRYLIIGLVLALLLAAGFGAWLIVDNSRTAVERDIIALLDDYGAAWEANDGAAVLALMTEDASVKPGNGVTYGVEEIGGLVDSLGDFSVERVGDPIITKLDTPFSPPGRWVVADAGYVNDSWHIMDLVRIVEQDGLYLIEYHQTWVGAG